MIKRVISHNGAIVTVETNKAVPIVNLSKVQRDYDPWPGVSLPRKLEKTDRKLPLETDYADDHLEEDVPQKDQDADWSILQRSRRR